MKTITITQDGSEYIIHLQRFAADAQHIRQTREFGSTWSHTWLRAGLIAFQENGDVSLTPRGEDLLASLPYLPDDPEPETAIKPCSKCNGSGEQVLFAYMETCDQCKGSKIEPRTAGHIIADFAEKLRGLDVSMHENRALPRTGYSAFICPTESYDVTEHPWVLIDSEKAAQQFFGKRVQVDAPTGVIPKHDLHGSTTTILGVAGAHLCTTGTSSLGWRDRGNVRLRLVDGDPS